jgi:hypothetical protein
MVWAYQTLALGDIDYLRLHVSSSTLQQARTVLQVHIPSLLVPPSTHGTAALCVLCETLMFSCMLNTW